MSRRALIVAATAAVLGALCLHLYLDRFESEAVGGPPRGVVFATRDLERGALLGQADVAIRALPERYVDERHIAASDLDRVLGSRLTTAVPSGSSLCWSDLDTLEPDVALANLVRPGLRGYALAGASFGARGSLRPGDRVDVLWTQAGPPSRTTLLLQNVLVLETASSSGSARAAAITLGVSTGQAPLLAQAERQGGLTLTLRNPHDALLDPGTKSP
jgi:Flp pilus assembly protein CpaB